MSGLTVVGSTLYGTLYQTGSIIGDSATEGTIFSIGSSGSGFQVLHAFTATGGLLPQGTLTAIGSTLYGTTLAGGTGGFGTIFSDGSRRYRLPSAAFLHGADGELPIAGLIAIGSKLYGTAHQEAAMDSAPCFH